MNLRDLGKRLEARRKMDFRRWKEESYQTVDEKDRSTEDTSYETVNDWSTEDTSYETADDWSTEDTNYETVDETDWSIGATATGSEPETDWSIEATATGSEPEPNQKKEIEKSDKQNFEMNHPQVIKQSVQLDAKIPIKTF